jgi:hypothetical protein
MKKIIILMPLFNDWESATRLLNKIDELASSWSADISALIINDASTEKRSGLEFNFKKIKSVKILNMKKNTVHQRCIAVGLKHICTNEDFDRVIIMDADGEDRPEELNDFYKKAQENPNVTITANRFKRSEGILFRFLYEVHKLITLVFTGKLIKFGNFTCLPKKHVQELVEKPYLWNSYSSSVIKTIKDRISIPSIRGTRYVQPSKMNFFGLVFHSLAIISVLRREFIIRSIIFFLVYLFLISNSISMLTLFPLLLFLLFVFTVLKISLRTNKAEFDKSLDNIGSIDTL